MIRAAPILAGCAASLWLLTAAAAPPSQPSRSIPEEQGSSGSSLSHRLDRSGGVIRPPADVDPGMAQPPPSTGSHSMPVVPPPGTPGGNPAVKPK
jgi:hypothetical protein